MIQYSLPFKLLIRSMKQNVYHADNIFNNQGEFCWLAREVITIAMMHFLQVTTFSVAQNGKGGMDVWQGSEGVVGQYLYLYYQ